MPAFCVAPLLLKWISPILIRLGLFLAEEQLLSTGGSMSEQQRALHPPPPQFNDSPPPSFIAPIFFAQSLLPMYNVANGVDGWKRLEITIEIMN